MGTVVRRPSAWVPLVLSIAALALIVGYVVRFGIERQADEGTAARIFQLLMLGNAVAITYFAVRWVPTAGRPAIVVLAAQLLAAAIPLVVLRILEW